MLDIERHPSVIALLNAHPNSKDPKIIIRRLAQSKIAYAQKLGWSGPPFCPKTFCSLFGIKCNAVQHDIASDGRLILTPSGSALIEYRDDRIIERIRFTIFHEFAHTLFPDYCQFVLHHHNFDGVHSSGNKEFETLCDIAAAEMLFPRDEFYASLSKIKKYDFDSIIELKRKFNASIDATCLRISDLDKNASVAFLFLTDQREPKYRGSGPLWLKYSAKTSKFPTFLESGISPPKDSTAYLSLNNDESMVSRGAIKETWWIQDKPRTFWVEAIKLISVDNPKYPKILVKLLTRKDSIVPDITEPLLF